MRYEDRLNSYRMTPEELAAEDRPAKLRRALDAIESADRVVIGGAAGLSAAGGIDYFSEEFCRRVFPLLADYGFHTLWDALWCPDFTPEQKWAVSAMEICNVRFDYPLVPVYTDLLDVVRDTNYFVLTSNGDEQFRKAGFPAERYFAPQGDLAYFQCCTPCCQEVWYGEEILRRIVANTDPRTLRCRTEDLPTCPHCGGPARLNTRGDDTFVRWRTMQNRDAFEAFVMGGEQCRMVFLELGAGFNSPGMIRHPFQRLTARFPQAMLLRFNWDYPKVPEQIAHKAIWFGGDMAEAIASLAALKRARVDKPAGI